MSDPYSQPIEQHKHWEMVPARSPHSQAVVRRIGDKRGIRCTSNAFARWLVIVLDTLPSTDVSVLQRMAKERGE